MTTSAFKEIIRSSINGGYRSNQICLYCTPGFLELSLAHFFPKAYAGIHKSNVKAA